MIFLTLTICDPSSSSSGLLFSLKQNLAVFSQSKSFILLSARHNHSWTEYMQVKSYYIILVNNTTEGFSFECQRVTNFASLGYMYTIGLKKFHHFFISIRCLFYLWFFWLLRTATSCCLKFWLNHWIACVLCDWLKWLNTFNWF